MVLTLAQGAFIYEEIKKHIGCTLGNSNNLGMMGTPEQLLDGVQSACKEGGSKCEELGKSSCDMIPNCWGFAINEGWGVQIYNSSASNPSLCTGTYGLRSNNGWKTFKKLSSNPNGK